MPGPEADRTGGPPKRRGVARGLPGGGGSESGDATRRNVPRMVCPKAEAVGRAERAGAGIQSGLCHGAAEASGRTGKSDRVGGRGTRVAVAQNKKPS